jgi:hypothetical protein
LQEKGGKGLTRNPAVWVHRYSIASLVIGLGVGFLLGRSLGKATTARRSQPTADWIRRILLTAHHGGALVVLPVPRRWVLYRVVLDTREARQWRQWRLEFHPQVRTQESTEG